MQKLSKFYIFLSVLFSLFSIRYTLFPMPSSAQVPGLRFPCDETDSPEFHSLRPYQASPCGGFSTALYCSNDLIFIESFDMKGTSDDCSPQNQGGEGTWVFPCTPDGDDFPQGGQIPPHDLLIELDDSMFPIMGNTEDNLDDATKVNEYASWYLSGVNNKAETGISTDEQVVNFSGPVNKLLPKMIQEAERIETIEKATIKKKWYDEDERKTYTTPQNHDQIVVCASKEFLGLFGQSIPKPCYNSREYRLSEWLENLSFLRGISNFGVRLFELLPDWAKGYVGGLVDDATTVAWNHRFPPLPWDDGTVTDNPDTDDVEKPVPFETDLAYRKAYNEWQGKSCVIVPILGLTCVDNPGVTNTYADLYSYIPLSSTADKKGAEYQLGDGPTFDADAKTTIEDAQFKEIRNAPLYFAHTQEVKELSELLNKTYTPNVCETDEKGVTNCNLLENVKLPKTTENNFCSVANVRVNKGDNLFPGNPDEMQVNGVEYQITEATCKEIRRKEWRYCPDLGDMCERMKVEFSCPAQITIKIRTGTKTPNANEIFSNTVADSGSTFRKIFPKVEVGAPVSCIADIPTVTDVTYTATNTLQDGKSEFKVGRFPEDGAGDSPQLTFPHFGSVYEYFLKGIQTALRPKGYGEPITDGTLCSDLESGDCSFDIAKINKAIKNAADKYKVPEKLLRSIFEIESYEYIADPSSYVCEENFAGAVGVAQIVKSTYDTVVCPNEKMDDDIGMCGDYDPKLSRCSIDDAFELMARILIFKAGRFRSCNSTNGISESEKMVWYNAACNYYGSHEPDDLTRGLQNDLPASARRPDGDMNYCDIVCQKMGQCPEYPFQ